MKSPEFSFTECAKKGYETSECIKMMEEMIESFEVRGEFVGAGRTANVMKSGADPEICMKIVHTKDLSDNNVKKEISFNEELSNLNFPVPLPICFVTTDENDYYFQELINGISLKQLVEEDRIDELPKDFDFRAFFNELSGHVKRMNDLGFHHRDLHTGNIMINESGKPVIIDFGDAIKSTMDSDDPYRCTDSRGILQIKPRDSYRVTQNMTEVGNYLKNNKWFEKN